MATVLFKNVNVLDGTGAPPFAGQVLVEGNRIKAWPRGAPPSRPMNPRWSTAGARR